MSEAGLIGVAPLDSEEDVVTVRQRARWVAGRLGFDRQDQVRVATAVSEIARNAVAHGGGGEVRFGLDPPRGAASLVIEVIDRGKGGRAPDWRGILDGSAPSAAGPSLGLRSARRLVDVLEISSAAGAGARVLLRKTLPARPPPDPDLPAALRPEFGHASPTSPLAEMRQQHRELLASLEELRRRQDELAELNAELEDTNRGVVALYAEIEERADALRQANELKSRFLSHMSHEFRTPLNAILSLTGLLLDRSDGDLTSEQERQVQYVRSAAVGLVDLVNDLLDLAKVKAGKAEAQPAPFRVVDLFGALRGMLRPLLGSDTVSLVFEPAEDIPTLCTDEAKVSQVLRNFISNALKFTEAGEVRVGAEARAGTGTVVFSVRDTGIGIAPEHQERIFDEYFQMQSRLQGRVKGTGLGLALSMRLAELLGGRIWMESAVGEGSAFFLEVPLELRRDDRPAPQEAAPVPVGRVLIIDDEETSRYILRRLIKDLPYVVSEAADGREGLLRSRVEQPDLVLLDLRLPGMDGYQVLERLGEDPQTSDIPVVIVTSSAIDPSDRHRLARAAGIFWKDALSRESVGSLLAHARAPGGADDRTARAHP